MPLPDWITTLMPIIKVLYYPSENVYRLPDGQRIISLQPLITATQEYMFKHKQQSCTILNSEYGLKIQLLYPIGIESAVSQD